MDQQTAEVITIAIEQQKQNEKELAQQQAQNQNNGKGQKNQNNNNQNGYTSDHDEEILQLAEQAQQAHSRNEGLFELSEEAKQAVRIQQAPNAAARNEATKLPRDAAHKSFAVDPSLKVAVGLVSGIVGPKTSQSDFVDTDDHEVSCTRCKKKFLADLSGKSFKLCQHCRALQRQRSRRWQQKTKEKEGCCRRCGTSMQSEDPKFVLCAHCRLGLRTRKANRYENGKCVHCSGVNDSTEYKVCTRCRDNDKQRRRKLESEGRCNRCAVELKDSDGGHKVCYDCRTKKKRFGRLGTDAATAAAAAAAHRAVQPIQGSIHDLRSEVESTEPVVDPNSQLYQQQVAQQLEANLFASRTSVQQTPSSE